ncbi:unnamed protein product [Phytomonas sp. Hart1]|nr:unnamed protein product [Phytomonas sp. Hart1]|eukprot:CCW70368.1 unnamed protein product [Phytomonas sp. isolate Hart1]
MQQSELASGGPSRFSCSSCRFTTHFCPCCGEPLRGSTSFNRPKSRALCSVPFIKIAESPGCSSLPRTAKTAFSVLDQAALEWPESETRLPPRPLSAFEVFCHEITWRANAPTNQDAEMQNAQVEVSSSSSEITNPGDLDPWKKDAGDQHRSLAQQWFYADQQLRETCEKRANAWSNRWKDPTYAPCVAAPMPSRPPLAIPPPALPSAKISSAAPPQPPVQGKKRDIKPNVNVSSYQLFRTANKGKFSSQGDAIQAWRALSPNSKIPFDEAAAVLRVQRLLQLNGKGFNG